MAAPSCPRRSRSCSPPPEATHERARRLPVELHDLRPRDPVWLRRDLEGPGNPADAADVGCQLDPRHRARGRDVHRDRGGQPRRLCAVVRRRGLRDAQRRRRVRRHRPDAPDVPTQARGAQGREGGGLAVDWIQPIVYLVWLAGAVAFVLRLIQMNSPATARSGNLLSAGGMALAILATAVLLLVKPEVASTEAASVAPGFNAVGWLVIIAGIAVGGGLGLYNARTVKMTAMPQLVSLFNAVGGGAAALIALDDYLKFASAGSVPGLQVNVATVLDVVIGSITFTGSLIASGKLMGLKITPSRPVRIPGGQLVTLALALITVAGAVFLWSGNVSLPVMGVILLAALVFGVTMTLPIGGADMPVVISLLNSFTGMAVAMAGFVLGNPVLIIGGALVGASGAILTKLMADAMNRSVLNIMLGGFGGGDS